MLGIVGKKVGMSSVYTDKGAFVPVTLIQVYECCVCEVKEVGDKPYKNVVLGYDKPKNPEKQITKPELGYFKKIGVSPYRKKGAVQVSKDKTFNVGDILGVDFLKGVEAVDITGTSKGKGFAGPMKRHHFGGLPATHGVSISHRSHGSTGQRMSPSKVFKGKRMAGHLGSETTTIKNLKVLEINPEDNVLVVKGAIPGAKGEDVIIKTVRH